MDDIPNPIYAPDIVAEWSRTGAEGILKDVYLKDYLATIKAVYEGVGQILD